MQADVILKDTPWVPPSGVWGTRKGGAEGLDPPSYTPDENRRIK